MDEKFALRAVVAHARHTETNYDELLAHGMERSSAHEQVGDEINKVLASWK